MKCVSLQLLSVLLPLFLWAADGPGFRTQRLLESHYAKHGHEFGRITEAEYLKLAQELRDAPLSSQVLEARRHDGVFTRFHRHRGHFGAYNRDRTIRTFFIPVRGEDYFRRQARR
jgi:pyocin large subunit-like protein